MVACEFSGIVRDEFIKAGHYAISCDLLPSESDLGPHYQGDILHFLKCNVGVFDLMIAHPPCTYLTNAGVRHLHENITSKKGNRTSIFGKARMIEMEKACDFFNKLRAAPINRIAIENPVPHKYAKAYIDKYDQLVRPWMFGNPENKAICLWLKGLPQLKPTNIISERTYKVHNCPPSKDRWKIRSRFFPEVAQAMVEQWSI